MSAAMKQVPYWLFGVTAFASLATVIAPLAYHGISETGWQLATRYTVRVSFPLFLLTYLAGPLLILWRSESSRWLMRNRRYLGLSFAIAHTTHLAALTSLFIFIGEAPDLTVMLGGGLAYALMFAMAATSNDQCVKALGVNWNRLHKAGLHTLWFVFLFTYLGRIFDREVDDPAGTLLLAGIVGSSLVFGAFLVRLLAAWKRRQRGAPA